jgi:hypothetical protein
MPAGKLTPFMAVLLLSGTLSFAEARVIIYAPSGPPVSVREVVTVAPGTGYVWIGGYHRWEGGAYLWTPGRWELAPRAHARWSAGVWRHDHHHGWYWTEGHWR